MSREIRIGCAGWQLRKDQQPQFPGDGTHLQRYAARFDCVEINSSFYREHRPATYARWADDTPDNFRFAVKMPGEITHRSRLRDVGGLLDSFVSGIGRLQHKLAVVLVQLPPSLKFEPELLAAFADELRQRYEGWVAFEPRHPSWAGAAVDQMLADRRFSRVAADPPRAQQATVPSGYQGSVYYRLHGSPRVYYSAYSNRYLDELAQQLASRADAGAGCWCIFDNTAEGAATENAFALQRRLHHRGALR